MSNTEALKIARDALTSASAYHGVQLMSDPPQDAWKFHRVAERIQGAIAAIDAIAQQQPSAPSVEPAAYLVRHPKNSRCSYVSTEPPQQFRADTGEPDALLKFARAIERAHNIPAAQEGR